MRALFLLILTGIVAWMTAPGWIGSSPSDKAVMMKVGAYVAMYVVLLWLTRKRE